MRHRMHTRAGAVLSVVVLVSSLTVLLASGASAAPSPAKIWVGPAEDCEAGWTCVPGPVVVQDDQGSGQDQTVHCAADCEVTQINTSGKNTVIVEQSTTIEHGLLAEPLAEVIQRASQSAKVTQQNGGVGINEIRSSQTITLDATTNLNVPVAHLQDGRQKLRTKQTSALGDQTLLFTQKLDFESNVEAPRVVQRQNAEHNGVPDQDVAISMVSGDGKNTVAPLDEFTQHQVFKQHAWGPGGSGLYQGATQQQGDKGTLACSPEPCQGADADAAGRIVAGDGSNACDGGCKFESSNETGGIRTNSVKDWSDVTAEPASFGSNSRIAFDELQNVLGKLSPPNVNANMAAFLGNQGTRICIQEIDWNAEVKGEGHQNCDNQKQDLTAKNGHMKLVCTNGDCKTKENVGGSLPPAGAFVIGDLNSAVGSKVNWWGDKWAANNQLSGGTAPSSFKGFENTDSDPKCGDPNWRSTTGNSPPPASSVPEEMIVIVASKVTQKGSKSEPTGDIKKVVVVQTDPGYAPTPSTPGTGTVVRVICESE